MKNKARVEAIQADMAESRFNEPSPGEQISALISGITSILRLTRDASKNCDRSDIYSALFLIGIELRRVKVLVDNYVDCDFSENVHERQARLKDQLNRLTGMIDTIGDLECVCEHDHQQGLIDIALTLTESFRYTLCELINAETVSIKAAG